MSCYVHLACLSHEPPILSHDEVGQHLRDLPEIREEVSRFRAAGVSKNPQITRFLSEHTHCRIAILDETGREHALDEVEKVNPYTEEVSLGLRRRFEESIRETIEEYGLDVTHQRIARALDAAQKAADQVLDQPVTAARFVLDEDDEDEYLILEFASTWRWMWRHSTLGTEVSFSFDDLASCLRDLLADADENLATDEDVERFTSQVKQFASQRGIDLNNDGVEVMNVG